ncbi:protein translocase subunit SecF [candidate division WS5 bacterium]|uniref:Protein-export membrane protein SecF n=1 Tax=candidate division WS5 bacterium TaxID=2093353 RepID=A0A419DF24_9BACT|nr:MAG: protein translocase subunit SecF [candidate division WS5 bacterium]
MNIMKHKKVWFGLSLAIILPGIVAVMLWGLRLSIDFTGGSLMEISGSSDGAKVEEIVKKEGGEVSAVQKTGDNSLIIRTKELPEDKHRKIKEKLEKDLGAKETRFETVGPTVSKDITFKSFELIAGASVLIVLFLAYSFRKVPKPVSSWQFGVTAIITLLHDVLLMIGVFAILGHFFGIEVDSMFVVAALTVIGFSVHDTIVVFDRIRENLIKRGSDDFEELANDSVLETFSRSINTSFLTFLVLLTLFLLGGSTTKTFVLALLVGIATGTYSSIFNAAPILVVWQNWKTKRSK